MIKGLPDVVASVLLKPREGDHHGLVKPGAPFAAGGRINSGGERRPHWMTGWVCGVSSHDNEELAVSWVMTDGTMDFGQLPPRMLHLRLAWESKIVPEGCDRAARCLDIHHLGGTVFAPGASVHHYDLFFNACTVLGTLTFLDAEGYRLEEKTWTRT